MNPVRITFAGSSHGVPEPNRKCSCLLLEAGEKAYFIDMGTPGIDFLRSKGVPIENIEAIFISHMHGDHTNGLISFVDLLTWYFKQADPLIFLPVMDAARVISEWMTVAQTGEQRQIRYRQTEAGVIFDDGTIRVTACPTQHCYRSFSYLVEADGKTVLYTGDLKNPAVDMPSAFFEKEIDLLICESAHFPATDYAPLFEKAHVKSVCVTHYTDRHLPSVLELCRALEGKGIHALYASDNLILNV